MKESRGKAQESVSQAAREIALPLRDVLEGGGHLLNRAGDHPRQDGRILQNFHGDSGSGVRAFSLF